MRAASSDSIASHATEVRVQWSALFCQILPFVASPPYCACVCFHGAVVLPVFEGCLHVCYHIWLSVSYYLACVVIEHFVTVLFVSSPPFRVGLLDFKVKPASFLPSFLPSFTPYTNARYERQMKTTGTNDRYKRQIQMTDTNNR